MTNHSEEIHQRVTEIRAIAAGLPQGGDVAILKTELAKLANWANQTLLFLGRIDNKPCRCCLP